MVTSSDECDEPHMFRCDVTSCVSRSRRCNGVSECANGRDESVAECGEQTVVWTGGGGEGGGRGGGRGGGGGWTGGGGGWGHHMVSLGLA